MVARELSTNVVSAVESLAGIAAAAGGTDAGTAGRADRFPAR